MKNKIYSISERLLKVWSGKSIVDRYQQIILFGHVAQCFDVEAFHRGVRRGFYMDDPNRWIFFNNAFNLTGIFKIAENGIYAHARQKIVQELKGPAIYFI